jgi:hypothetical protein
MPDRIADEKIDKDIIKSILEYHHIDKTGQKFRRPASTEDEPPCINLTHHCDANRL